MLQADEYNNKLRKPSVTHSLLNLCGMKYKTDLPFHTFLLNFWCVLNLLQDLRK